MQFDVRHKRAIAVAAVYDRRSIFPQRMRRSQSAATVMVSIINAFELPAVGALLAATDGAALEFQIPLGALPRFFVPPIPGSEIRPALICDFAVDLRAAKMRWLVYIE